MSAPALRPSGQAAVEMELLAQLGLPASASPEDVDQLHQSASDFLSSAPPEIRGWARAQVAALDAAYITLTDPAGLEGSALRSPASPPAVVPGGPATPPARRGPAPEAAAPVDLPAGEADEIEIEGEPSVEDLAALYAMVTPSAHDDMKPDAKRAKPSAAKPVATRAPSAAPAVGSVTPPAGPNIWKRIVIGTVGIAAILGVAFSANLLVNSGASGAPAPSQVAQASSGAPTVDLAKIGEFMTRLQANPEDVDALLALGTEYYAGGEFQTAGTWFDKVLAIDPEHVEGLLARGAVFFNLVDLASAEATWKKVAAIEPDNVEVHYDLGFLYLNQPSPNWAGVQEEWNQVIALDPTSDLAKTVKSHLESLAGASMLPGGSPGTSAAPAASPAASPSAAPAASPAASTVP